MLSFTQPLLVWARLQKLGTHIKHYHQVSYFTYALGIYQYFVIKSWSVFPSQNIPERLKFPLLNLLLIRECNVASEIQCDLHVAVSGY